MRLRPIWLALAAVLAACGDVGSTPAEVRPIISPLVAPGPLTWPPQGDLEGRVAVRSPNGEDLQVDFYLARDGGYRFEDGRGVAVYNFEAATAKSLHFKREEGESGSGAVIAGFPLASPETTHAFATACLKWDLRGFRLASMQAPPGLAPESRKVTVLGLEASEFTVAAKPEEDGDAESFAGVAESTTHTCDKPPGCPSPSRRSFQVHRRGPTKC
jgi:hypothetical protein